MEHKDVFVQPDSLKAAAEALAGLTPDSVILAGGTDLMIALREKRPEVDRYLSLCAMEELKTISREDGWLKIGSMVTHEQAAGSRAVQKYFRALSMACSHVGSQQIRNKGTLGGNVMNGSPAGDIIPCVWLYEGELEFLTPDGKLRMGIEEFFAGGGKKAIPQSILTAIYLPIGGEDWDSCFIKLGSRKEVTIAQISICTLWRNQNGSKCDVRALMGAVDTIPVRCGCEKLLAGESISEESGEQAAEILKDQIRKIRETRTRESKTKITEAEKLYKERAVRGLLFDVIEDMNQRGR